MHDEDEAPAATRIVVTSGRFTGCAGYLTGVDNGRQYAQLGRGGPSRPTIVEPGMYDVTGVW